jgi:hypothetical protein
MAGDGAEQTSAVSDASSSAAAATSSAGCAATAANAWMRTSSSGTWCKAARPVATSHDRWQSHAAQPLQPVATQRGLLWLQHGGSSAARWLAAATAVRVQSASSTLVIGSRDDFVSHSVIDARSYTAYATGPHATEAKAGVER